jgi:uncharacterized protein
MTTSRSSNDPIARTAEHIRGLLADDSSGHDWWHIWRVWQTAIAIGRAEGADLLVVELAALVHDIADWKFHGGDETLGPRRAAQWLAGLGVEQPVIDHVSQIVAGVSFKGAGVPTPMPSLEGRVVQDADRLDAIGAIGIARAFAYGGHAGRALYDPEHPPESHASFEAYKRGAGPTINHFHEKLMLLKDRMQTATGRRLAAERHAFMEQFLARFDDEWHGRR